MTLIIAVVDESGSYMGSDSMGSNGHTGGLYKNKKVFRLGPDILAGGCGSYKELQLLEKDFSVPRRFAGQSGSEYMYNTFSHELKQFFVKHNMLSNENGIVSNNLGEFLFVYEGVIYKWQGDLAMLETTLSFDVTGSGETYAHGVMAALVAEKSGLSAEKRIKRAIYLTSKYVLSVGGKPDVIKIKNADDQIAIDKQKKKE